MTVNNIASNALSKEMLQLSTGKRINSAADDAAGLSIAEKLLSSANGKNVGIANAEDFGNLLNTAESSLSSVNDVLSRMRDLATQASNGILTSEDKNAIQTEINQLKEEITSITKNSEYNSVKLLDGSFAGKNLASNQDGTGMEVTIEKTSLEVLGLEDFDVTKNFDISSIDNAIQMVSSASSNIGSITNTIGHIINANKNAYVNEISSLSRLSDLDLGEGSMRLNNQKAIEQLQLFSIQRQQEREKNKYTLLTQ